MKNQDPDYLMFKSILFFSLAGFFSIVAIVFAIIAMEAG